MCEWNRFTGNSQLLFAQTELSPAVEKVVVACGRPGSVQKIATLPEFLEMLLVGLPRSRSHIHSHSSRRRECVDAEVVVVDLQVLVASHPSLAFLHADLLVDPIPDVLDLVVPALVGWLVHPLVFLQAFH